MLIKDNTINNPNFNPPKVAVGEIQAMLDCYTHMSDRKAKRAAEAAAAKANDKASDKVSPKGKGKPPKAADKPADPKVRSLSIYPLSLLSLTPLPRPLW